MSSNQANAQLFSEHSGLGLIGSNKRVGERNFLIQKDHFSEVMMTPVTYFRYLLLAVALYSPGLFGQSTDKNFVLTRTYKAARTTVSGNVKDATQEVAYLDGLGRPLQSISAQASPLLTGSRSADLVSHTEYDASGRPFMQYAPYPVQGNGAFRSNAAAAAVDYYNNSSNFCQNNNRGYTLLEYEAVPDEKVKKQYVAGSERAIEYIYRGNATGEVKRYVVSGTNVQYPGDYGAGQLSCVQTKDENGNRTREYQDKTGSVVLRRVYLSDNDSDKLDTYYVYDDYGQLRFVLQPQFQDNANIDLYAFKYTYNSKGLVSSKYVPGGGTTNMVYDERDRLKESTDGRGKITYYKYDELNRVTETGEKSGSTETPLSRVHYDTYSPSFGGNEAFVGAGGDYPGGYRTVVKGKQTVSANRVLNADGSYGSWLYATVYYDDRYNPIQTIRTLFDIGGTARERNSNLRRFDGRIEKELTLQQTGSGDYSVEKLYSYDHSDRQLSSRYIVKKGSDVKKDIYLSASRYNGIGQLKNKFLHSVDAAATFREKLDYCYTPRNFLSKITGSASSGENYGLELRYTNPAEATAQYNGNIAEMLWKRGTSWVGYKFSYDRANRLTNGDGLNNNYRETVTGYDRNGNITGLQRVSNGSNIDNLTYDYSANGNRLKKVTDAENNANGFNNGSSGSSDDYAYDGNGNLTQDLNRGIAAGGLRYNFNNLVREAIVGSYTVQYHFDASGTKLRMSNSNGAVNTKYAGAFEYNQGNYLTRIATQEGQVSVTNNGNDFSMEYYLNDHLGNVRQVINESGTIVQETEYYPFGMAIPRIAGANKYLYNGKEKQPETNWLDYGARMYDPTVGRWMVVDPMGDQRSWLSPFNYVQNNPLSRIDPDGKLDGPGKSIYDKIVDFAKNTEFKLSVSGSFGLQANIKLAKVAEAEVNAYSVKIFDGGFSVKDGVLEGRSQVMNMKTSSALGETKDKNDFNAPVEEKAALGIKFLGAGIGVEATADSDRHGNRSNEKAAVKMSGNYKEFSSTKVYEFTGSKMTEKTENSYTIGGAFLLGVELKLDLTREKKNDGKK